MVNIDKRRQIIEGVWAVIAESGLSAVSMRTVAAAARVSVGRVQHYFGSRTELVRMSVVEMLHVAEIEHLPASESLSGPENLWTLIAHSLEPAKNSRVGVGVYFAYVAASAGDPWIANQLAHAKEGQISAVAELLERDFLNMPDPVAVATRLVALADGYAQAVYLGYVDQGEAMRGLREAIVCL